MENLFYDKIGIFIKELPNRFMALVLVDGNEEICYVKSSSRLQNYINLKNKIVYLKYNCNSKFKYYILAVKLKRNYMLLCPLEANNIVLNNLNRRFFSFLGKRSRICREKKIGNYKSDIFLPESNKVIEVKAVISEFDNAELFTVYSNRFEIQLDSFYDLLNKNFKVFLIIVNFNPYAKCNCISTNNYYYGKIKELISKGLIIKSFSCEQKNGNFILKKNIKLKFDD